MAREIIDVDIVCVGAGVASLATVLRLLRRIESSGISKDPPRILVVDKGRQIGNHILSGAIVDTDPLLELLTEEEFANMPIESHVTSETFLRLFKSTSIKLPFVPKPMRSKEYPIVSLSKVSQWLCALCEKTGAEIYSETTAAKLLSSDGRIRGVRLADTGHNKNGNNNMVFDPGHDIHAKAVILGEGAHGCLTESLIKDNGLGTDTNSQVYALGIKELLKHEARPASTGRIYHTFGYPHDYYTYGGGFVYRVNDTHTAVGLVTALDYRSAKLNPHDQFRLFKNHPVITDIIRDGTVVEYGAKVMPESGYFGVPDLVADGAIIVGDAAGLLDTVRLKGVHLAVQSGIAAGDTLFNCWKTDDWSKNALMTYSVALKQSKSWKQLKRIKNVRASFKYGTLSGMLAVGMSLFTHGLFPPGRLNLTADHKFLRSNGTSTDPVTLPPADQALQMDRLHDIYYSGTEHREDQPSHVKIIDPARCRTECMPLYGAPCTRFCPAQVYEQSEDGSEIRIQSSNCLHCKTCLIKDPLQNIEWTLPEGGGGPRYTGM